jgi:membrane protein
VLERVRHRIAGAGQRLGERFPVLRTAWAVQRRFGEVNGGYLASAITLAAFLSLFPLLLVAIAVLGFFSHNDPNLPHSALRFLGLSRSSDAARLVTDAIAAAEKSRAAASIVGTIGLLWSGLGLVAALQYAYDAVWQVTGRGLKDKAVGLVWLIGAATLFVASFAVTALVSALPAILAPLNFAVGVALSFALFLWTARVLPKSDVGWKPLVPGAIVGAVGLEVLKIVGAIYVPRAVASSSAMYGSIGIVFAILAWLFFFGRLIVYSAVTSVVRWEEQHGTTTIDIRVPNLPGPEDDMANRSGEQQPVAS